MRTPLLRALPASAAAILWLLAPAASSQTPPPGMLPTVTPGESKLETFSSMGNPLVTVSDLDSQTGTLLPLSTSVQQSGGVGNTLSHLLLHSASFASARSGTVHLFHQRSDATQFGTSVIFGASGSFRYAFSVDAPTTVTVDYDALFTESNPGNSWWAMPTLAVEVFGVTQNVAMPFLPPKPFSPQVRQGSFVFAIPAGDFYLRIYDGSGASGNQWGGARELTVSAGWRIGPPVELTDLGNGLAGTLGVPQLSGTGSLIAGSPFDVQLGNTLPNTSATLVMGLTALYAPLKGGVLVPMVDVLLPGLATDGNGEIVIATTWPADLPSGFSFYAQFWMADPGGPLGFAASNAIQGEVP